MKYINKNTEPKELLDWKEKDKMALRGNPKWNRIPSSIKNIVRENLRIEQGYICCYCESSLEITKSHSEHLKPVEYYKDSQLDYKNLLCSCQLELEKGEPRHCGNSKGSWYEENLLISPLNPDCEKKFSFTYDGLIKPTNENDKSAVTTIEKLQLNIEKLNALRRSAIEPFIEEHISQNEMEIFVLGYLINKEDNEGKFNEFYTTIKYLFG